MVAAGDVRVEPVPVRVPDPDEAVVEVAYGGVCGSDLHYWRHGAAGPSVLKEPMLLGHEIVGTVRHGADDGSGPAPGTAVAVHPARPAAGDGTQRYPADRPNLSPGCSYLGSAAHRPRTQGGFVRYLTIPARMLRSLPAGLALRTAAVAEPASVAWHAGLIGAEATQPVAAPSSLVIGLSSRELDVLRLVADGCSNREIGERLFISEKTAGRHLSNIFTKLDVHNRAEAARIAAEQGLTQP